jgi:hypothetical protein
MTSWYDNVGDRVLVKECEQVNVKKSNSGQLSTSADGIVFSGKKVHTAIIPWNEIVDIQVNTSETSRVTVGRVLAIGVFALAAKKKEQFTVIEVQTELATLGFITNESQSSVLDSLRPLMQGLKESKKVGSQAEVPSQGTASIGDQLRELGALRDEGLLTDEEFERRKSRLLE